MKILPLALLASAMATATPITTHPTLKDASTPVLCDELVQIGRGALQSPGFQAFLSGDSPTHGEIRAEEPADVPEPDTILLAAGGLLVAAGVSRRQVRHVRSTVRS